MLNFGASKPKVKGGPGPSGPPPPRIRAWYTIDVSERERRVILLTLQEMSLYVIKWFYMNGHRGRTMHVNRDTLQQIQMIHDHSYYHRFGYAAPCLFYLQHSLYVTLLTSIIDFKYLAPPGALLVFIVQGYFT